LDAPLFSAPSGAFVHKPGLDLLRAIAIVWVMLFHSFVVGGLGPDYEWLSRYGWMGVDLFFVLSGFLIGTQVLAPLPTPSISHPAGLRCGALLVCGPA
jgi:peptidoglycan/LPS O-acetylase OafA/YrhL